jgi:RNA polymerase sigma-70 factor (ECF subfamily)
LSWRWLEESVEQGLVERAQSGDREAFGDLARQAGDRLYAIALRIVRDRDLAGDVTQQTLVHIWREIPRLRDPERFDAWSYRLVVNACYDELRRHAPRTVAIEGWDTAVPDASLTVHDRDQIERGFRRLSPDQRAVVILQYYLDYSLPQIAATLGIPGGTVRSRLHYARQTLRAALEADARQSLNGSEAQ